LPEFFVWSTPALVRLIDAADAQTVAEMFTERPVSPVPILGQLPICFVQATGGREPPAWTTTPSNVGLVMASRRRDLPEEICERTLVAGCA
jgi:hypothetical protein